LLCFFKDTVLLIVSGRNFWLDRDFGCILRPASFPAQECAL
jgi:hypothetical protein